MLEVGSARLHIREATGRNDGPEVELAQRLAGAKKGDPWCGCEMYMQQRLSGLPWPKWPAAARNWSLGTDARTFYITGVRGSLDSIRLGHIVTFYYPNLGRVGHVGRAVGFSRPVRAGRPVRGFIVRSGNTGRGGGRDGAGVYDVFYPAYSIYAASNWLY
ncbi:hypothetical protein GCM10023185_30940 [Hymenobacter saemangeumensis]|uniref:CHAP domain-containing protein n=1 Tax=Hymenobacter saemangeumensis TaxID=1084522 RepID=A0ABP8ILU6_9BACT